MKIKTLLTRVLPVIALAALGLIGWVKFEYGCGKPYPDIGSDQPATALHLEKLITLDYPPGNLAVAPNGHVYFNYHPIAQAGRFSSATVFEFANGRIEPFPSLEMQKQFRGTFGMTIDRQNWIWFVEPAAFDFPHTRLWAFDLQTKRQIEFFEFPGHEAQFAQDLRVTADGNFVLLANPGLFRFTASNVVVFSVKDRSHRVILNGHPLIQAEDWSVQTRFGRQRLVWGLLDFSVGVDGIEITPDQQWLYLAGMTTSRLCRVPMSAALNAALPPTELARMVEDVSAKPLSDGIAADALGRIILTDVEHGGIMAFDPAGNRLSTLVRAPDIIWPDGVVAGPDDAIYFTDSAISAYMTPLTGAPEKKRLLAHRPYHIYRLSR